MTAQPEMTGFGRPPAAPTGFRKFAPFITGVATGGFFLMAGLYFMQIGLPQRFTPGGVTGEMAGAEQVRHLQTAGDEQISYDVRKAAAEQALGVTTQAMQGAATIANGADLLCGASRIAENLAAQESANRSALTSDAAWWKGFFGRVGNSTCGVGTEVRNSIIGEVTTNGRQSGTLSVRDAQQAQQSRQTQPIPVKTVFEAFAIDRANSHYSAQDLAAAREYTSKLDSRTQYDLHHLLFDDDEGHDIFVERVRAYLALTHNY